ncbi:MAG: pyridoxamine 5'-phosphate oxidase family protein [Deltaproteobacteria bacterium]|nr:MAG: pyridoxamine 5'-phosphate oxidase family protein [Deltaproteobacteria bacterium]
MARIVGDKLVVNLARKPGEEQIIDLMQVFNRNPNKNIVVAGTVGPDGAPNTAPISLIYARDEKTLLAALLRSTTTTANLRHNGRISLEIIGPDDLVLGIQGTMRLIREPMKCSEAMAIWEMTVEKVKQDTSPAQRVIQGPASVPRSDKAAAFEKAGFEELEAAAKG